MNPKTAREEFAKVIEKYNLPEMNLLDKEIEMIDVLSERKEIPQDILAAVRRRFTEILYGWVNFLHSLVVPSPQSLIANKDAETFDEKEKDRIYRMMALLAKMTRESTSFEAKKGQPREEARFVRENFSKFMGIKKELAELNSRLVEHWQKEIESK